MKLSNTKDRGSTGFLPPIPSFYYIFFKFSGYLNSSFLLLSCGLNPNPSCLLGTSICSVCQMLAHLWFSPPRLQPLTPFPFLPRILGPLKSAGLEQGSYLPTIWLWHDYSGFPPGIINKLAMLLAKANLSLCTKRQPCSATENITTNGSSFPLLRHQNPPPPKSYPSVGKC